MTISLTHQKTNNITDWTQADLDAQIALGNFPPGTVLADIVIPSDWNAEHTITMGTGKILGRSTSGTGSVEELTVGNGLSLSSGELSVSLSSSGTSAYMLSGTNSDISGYESMVLLSGYTAGSLATTTVSTSTTPTILEEFSTQVGYPNITIIPSGQFLVHYETQKAAGSNNYYTYAEIYKRASGGTETLLATSDNSSQSSVNTVVQQTVTSFISSPITLLSTDRIVIKVYAVMVSGTVNITLRWDDNTNARFELPIYTEASTDIGKVITQSLLLMGG